MDLSLLVTIALIFLATSLVGFVRSRIADRCLRSFHGFQVTLLRTDGRQVWGRMDLSPGGIEFASSEVRVDPHGEERGGNVGLRPCIERAIEQLDRELRARAGQVQRDEGRHRVEPRVAERTDAHPLEEIVAVEPREQMRQCVVTLAVDVESRLGPG